MRKVNVQVFNESNRGYKGADCFVTSKKELTAEECRKLSAFLAEKSGCEDWVKDLDDDDLAANFSCGTIQLRRDEGEGVNYQFVIEFQDNSDGTYYYYASILQVKKPEHLFTSAECRVSEKTEKMTLGVNGFEMTAEITHGLDLNGADVIKDVKYISGDNFNYLWLLGKKTSMYCLPELPMVEESKMVTEKIGEEEKAYKNAVEIEGIASNMTCESFTCFNGRGEQTVLSFSLANDDSVFEVSIDSIVSDFLDNGNSEFIENLKFDAEYRGLDKGGKCPVKVIGSLKARNGKAWIEPDAVEWLDVSALAELAEKESVIDLTSLMKHGVCAQERIAA
jgi:hypothetical protein